MQIIVAGLGVNVAHFEQYTANTGGLLRWNYYPACPEPLKTFGLTAHTDFNLLTVVHLGEVGGLQIEKDGKWIAVRPHPGALAVNIGDTLQVCQYPWKNISRVQLLKPVCIARTHTDSGP